MEVWKSMEQDDRRDSGVCAAASPSAQTGPRNYHSYCEFTPALATGGHGAQCGSSRHQNHSETQSQETVTLSLFTSSSSTSDGRKEIGAHAPEGCQGPKSRVRVLEELPQLSAHLRVSRTCGSPKPCLSTFERF